MVRPCIQKHLIEELLPELDSLDPTFANLIKQHTSLLSLPVYRVSYQYGQKILDQGVFQIPFEDNKTRPLTDSAVSAEYKKLFGYRYIPISIIAQKQVEVFYDGISRITPSKLLSKGNFFGLWELFDPLELFDSVNSEFDRQISLSAGARTAFLLPKVSNNLFHERLVNAYQLKQRQAPNNLLEHFEIFQQIVASLKPDWRCEILILPEEWTHAHILEKLQFYWLSIAWKQSYNTRASMRYDVAWEAFAEEMTQRNWYPRLSTVNTIKHLLTVRRGIYPGFQAAQNEEALPLKCLQEAYLSVYQLKEYAPVIMQPFHLREKNTSVYYSMSLATSLEKSIQSRNTPRIIDELQEIQHVMKALLKYHPHDNAEYTFFHYDTDGEKEIKATQLIPEEDEVMNEAIQQYKQNKFPYNSSFLRGCIRIKLVDEF